MLRRRRDRDGGGQRRVARRRGRPRLPHLHAELDRHPAEAARRLPAGDEGPPRHALPDDAPQRGERRARPRASHRRRGRLPPLRWRHGVERACDGGTDGAGRDRAGGRHRRGLDLRAAIRKGPRRQGHLHLRARPSPPPGPRSQTALASHSSGWRCVQSSDEKLAQAVELGADHTINYRQEPEWGKAAKAFGGADHVIEIGGAGTLGQAMTA